MNSETSPNTIQVELKDGPHHLKMIEVNEPLPTRLTFTIEEPEDLDADEHYLGYSYIKRVRIPVRTLAVYDRMYYRREPTNVFEYNEEASRQ